MNPTEPVYTGPAESAPVTGATLNAAMLVP